MDIPIVYKKQIFFAAIFGYIIYEGYNDANDSVTNYKRGFLAAAFVLVSQGLLDQYTGPFTKKFPRFWRAVSRYTLFYLAALVFILFQTSHDARELMMHLDSTLPGKPVSKGLTYDDNCELEWANLYDNLDHYYLMHLVGWFVAALMIRDTLVVHFWSILDEILELSWQHIYPHFRECWWDHVLVDLLMSNTPAIYLGMLVIRKTGLREFDWLGRKGKKSVAEWDILHNHRRLGCVFSLVFIMASNFLTGFFTMNCLWVPPISWLNIYRLSVWFLLGSIAIGELYDDVDTWGTPQRLTTPISSEYRWICIGVAIIETMISYKFRLDAGNLKFVETPLYISIPWIITFVVCAGYYINLRFIRKNRTTKGGDSEWEIEERRKKSTRLAEKEKKLKAKGEAEAKGESQPKQVKAETQVTETANGKAKKQAQAQADQKKQADTKAQPAPVKAAEPTKKAAVPQEDDDEWKVAGGSKGGKQQQPQKPQKQQKKKQQEESEEEREEEPVRHEVKAPVEDEWKEIKSVKAVKKANKKKWE